MCTSSDSALVCPPEYVIQRLLHTCDRWLVCISMGYPSFVMSSGIAMIPARFFWVVTGHFPRHTGTARNRAVL